jgi:hypothetical protein
MASAASLAVAALKIMTAGLMRRGQWWNRSNPRILWYYVSLSSAI